jgi:trans-2,3-dihydro-3-hydroxyanthranilate isomerase
MLLSRDIVHVCARPGLEAIRKCQAHLPHWDAAFARDGRSSAHVFCRETVGAASSYYAQMFAPRLGVMEDPATGAGAAAFSGVLARFAPPPDGDHEVVIEHVHEMGRPSLIGLSVNMRDRRLAMAAISGEAILVSESTIEA